MSEQDFFSLNENLLQTSIHSFNQDMNHLQENLNKLKYNDSPYQKQVTEIENKLIPILIQYSKAMSYLLEETYRIQKEI